MFYALGWILVFSLFAMWSLGAWAFHVATAWALSQAGGISGAALGDSALPGWLAAWLPADVLQGLGEMLVGIGPIVDRLVQGAPALAGGLSAAIWVIWAVGSLLLLLTGVGLHALIAFIRRSARAGEAPGAVAAGQAR